MPVSTSDVGRNRLDKAVVILRYVLMGALLGSFGLALLPSFAARSAATIAATEETSSLPTAIARPVTLTIPTLKISADIVGVGVLKDGRMDTPKDAFDVGWFQKGPKPGEIGNAVLAGHLDTLLGTPGIFSELHTLKVGDEIQVTDEQGQVQTFRVKVSQIYKTHKSPVEKLFGKGSMPKLFLITCHGAWNKRIGDYENRLVVEAELVTEKDFSSRPSTL